MALVNEVFPDNATAFFNTVLMPRNLQDIPDVVRFATAIGWGVSVVPVHVTTPDQPRSYRTLDDIKVVTFPDKQRTSVKSELREVIETMKELRRNGYNLYDSDEYLDDILRFVVGEHLEWRRRNGNVCDSPNLYFAVAPNGNLKVCCDFELDDSYPVYDDGFPELFRSGVIHESVYAYTRPCDGCMYGSYPEITLTARFLKPMIERFLYFNVNSPKLQKLSTQEMRDIAAGILYERTGEVVDPAVDRAKIAN